MPHFNAEVEKATATDVQGKCIKKTNRTDPHERLHVIGRVNPEKLPENEAVAGIVNVKSMNTILARRALSVLSVVLLVCTMLGCSTVTVIDHSFTSATQYSRTEAMEVLKTGLMVGNRFVEVDEVGFRCREKMGFLGVPAPWTQTVAFAEVTKITTTQGA